MECSQVLEIALNNIDFEAEGGPKLRSLEIDSPEERLVSSTGLTEFNVQTYIELLRGHVPGCSTCVDLYIDYVNANKGKISFFKTEAVYLGVFPR